MEDAAIHETDIGDGKGLFAVFDGHGGINIFIKDLKYRSMLRRYLYHN